MTSRRSNRIKPPRPCCLICTKELLDGPKLRVVVNGRTICLACAIKTHDALYDIYNLPEVSAVQRILHEKKNGPDGLRRTPLSQKEPGWVYYIRMGDLIKIGYATDITKRMRAYPPTAELLAAHPGTPDLERDMHRRFAADLAQGREWFRESENLHTHIVSIVERFGDPSDMSYQYTRPKSQEEKVADMFKTRQHLEIARGVHSAV